MEAGGNSKGWISGGTVKGRGRECWRDHPRKAFLQWGWAAVGLGEDAVPGGEAVQKLREAFDSTWNKARGQQEVPSSREQQEDFSHLAGPPC